MTLLASMTGFARVAGGDGDAGWVWELRSVNGRGLELRLKLPAGLDRLEPAVRAAAAARLARGNVQISLSLRADDRGGVAIDRALLERLMEEAHALRDRVPGTPAPRSELLLALPGVIRRESSEDQAATPEDRLDAMRADFAKALDLLAKVRHDEGARLKGILEGLLDQLVSLRQQAMVLAAGQPELHQLRLAAALDRLLNGATPAPAERLAQEVALLAVRADVTEELDRLRSHLTAAAHLLTQPGPAGRQLDFLVQELMRETNTLCSKSASAELTSVALQMKAVIEQFREQVQNIE